MRGQERRTRLLVVREHERFEHARHCRLLNSFGATTNRHNTRTAVLQYRSTAESAPELFWRHFPESKQPLENGKPDKRQAGWSSAECVRDR